MQGFKSRSPKRTVWVVFIAFCGACNALLDNHPRDLEVVAPGAGGEAMVSPGAAGEGGLGGSESSAGEAGMTSGGSNEGGAAGSESEPAGGRAGSPTGGTAGMSQGGTSHGGMPACTGCTPGLTEPQTRDCGICNAGKESGTRTCTPSCTWETSWSGVCSDHGTAKNGCSFVKWCSNDAGRTECTLVGCTAKEAQDECRDEAASICTVKNLLMNTECP